MLFTDIMETKQHCTWLATDHHGLHKVEGDSFSTKKYLENSHLNIKAKIIQGMLICGFSQCLQHFSDRLRLGTLLSTRFSSTAENSLF